jgi:hypothetical protein
VGLGVGFGRSGSKRSGRRRAPSTWPPSLASLREIWRYAAPAAAAVSASLEKPTAIVMGATAGPVDGAVISELRLAALLKLLLLLLAPCWWAEEGGGRADGGGRAASQASLSGSATAVARCIVSLRSASVALRTLREAPVAKSTEMILGTTDESRHAASRSSKPWEMSSSEAPGLSRSSCVSRCVSSAW